MKALFPLWLTLAATSCAGVRETDMGTTENRNNVSPVTIDFQYGFNGEWLELQLNRQTVFSGALTTDERVGVARSVQYSPGAVTRLDALLIVNHSLKYHHRINLKQGRYVGFFKDLDDGRIRMEQSTTQFVYD